MLPLFDENPTRRRPVVTWLLVAVSIAVYLMAGMSGDGDRFDGDAVLPSDLEFTARWAAIPCEVVRGRPLRSSEVTEAFLGAGATSACGEDTGSAATVDDPAFAPEKPVRAVVLASIFLHDGLFHLAINMLFLWVFGNNVEDRLGHLPFLAFYLVAGVVGTLTYIAFQPSATVAVLGASGSVAGVMGSYLVWYPDAPIRTLVFLVLVDIRARWFLGGWFALQFFTWTGPGAWITHVAGFVFGVLVGRALRRILPRLRLRTGPLTPAWDRTGGAGHGPYPHLDEVWIEPHHQHYEHQRELEPRQDRDQR